MIDYIRQAGRSLGISEMLIDEADRLFLRVVKEKSQYRPFPHARSEVIALACLYSTVRSSKCLPLGLTAFTEKTRSQFPKKKIARVYRKLLEMDVAKPKVCYFNPVMFALDYARKLNYPAEAKHTIEEICQQVTMARLHVGRDPSIVGAQVTYMATLIYNIAVTQRELSEISKVTEQSIRQWIVLCDDLKRLGKRYYGKDVLEKLMQEREQEKEEWRKTH